MNALPKFALGFLVLFMLVPGASAAITQHHTTAYAGLTVSQQAASDFWMQSATRSGRGCGNSVPSQLIAQFDANTAASGFALVSGHRYLVTMGEATYQTSPGVAVQFPFTGSVSGTLFTLNLFNGGTPFVASSAPGVGAAVTTWYDDYNNTGTQMVTTSFVAIASEMLKFTCPIFGTQISIQNQWAPSTPQFGVTSNTIATFSDNNAPANSCNVGAWTIICNGVLQDIFLSPPSAPVASVSVSGVTCTVSWTTPSSGASAILGYNVTRTNPDGGNPVTFTLGLVNSMTDTALTTNRTYSVAAWSGVGTSPASNSVLCRQTPVPLFGDSSVLYGPGGSAGLASALGTSVTGATILYGIVVVMLFAGMGYAFFQAPGAVVGAVFGLFIAIAAGMFPLWLIVLLLVVCAAAFLLFRGRGGGA